MFELFPDQPIYEYPELVNISYSFAWAFLLSAIIAITHQLTYNGQHYPKNFFQSLVLGAIVTTMVMMAIGDSLARGLGVFGAMAIIRFRTRVDDPRDVLFLFAALSTGLAIGVYGFTISFIGTILFCAVAFILHYSPLRSFATHDHLYFTLDDRKLLEQMEQAIRLRCDDIKVVSIAATKDNGMRYQYGVSLKKDITKDQLIGDLVLLGIARQLKITSNEQPGA